MPIKQRKFQVMMIWVAVTLLGLVSSSQAEDLFVWQFQQSQAGTQVVTASAVDSLGNLILTGYTDTGDSNGEDIYTIKLSSDGQTVLWAARYPNPGDDRGLAVAVDGNDDVVVSGFLYNGVNDDIAVIKYKGADGTPPAQWGTTPYLFNSVVNGHDMAKGLALDNQNNIYVAGYSQTGGSTATDGILFKLNSSGGNPDGTPIWQVNFSGVADDSFENIAAGADGIALAGYTKVDHSGRLDFDYLIMKISYGGIVTWQKTYDNGYGDDFAYFAGMDSAGNVIVTGEVLSNTIHRDMRTLKYPAESGAPIWGITYSGGSPNIPKGMVVNSDGEIYVTGETFTLSGKDDFYTARYAADGNGGLPVWEKVFNSGEDNTDLPRSLAFDQAGGLYVSGYTKKAAAPFDKDFQTLKYNMDNGSQIWQKIQDGPTVGSNEESMGVSVAIGIDGNIYVGGWTQQASDPNNLDYYAVKYRADLLNSPTELTGTVISQTQIDLAWQDNSGYPTINPSEDNFCVDRCQGFGCTNFVQLTCAVPQDQTFYHDYLVTQDRWYTYRLRAKSSEKGSSLPSNSVSVLTTLIDFPAPVWLYTYDAQGLDDKANAIAMGSDNNPVATGLTNKPASQQDYYTVKLDRSAANPAATNPASFIWNATYDDVNGRGDTGTCLAVDANKDVVVSGFAHQTNDGIDSNDIFTIKYASTGPDPHTLFPLWTSSFNGPGLGDDRTVAIAAATDGTNNTVVTGYGRNADGNDDILLIKYKPDADASQEVWSSPPYDGVGHFNDTPTATAYTPAGNVVVVGSSERAALDSDVFISQYDGGTGLAMTGWPYIHDFGHGVDKINAVVVAADSSIYVAGYARNSADNLDIYVNKFNSSGIPQWGTGTIIDGDGHGYDEAEAIAIDPNDGDIVVAATVTSTSGSKDLQVLRFAADGTLRWQKTLDLISHDELLTAMAISPSGEICLVGETDNDTYTDVIAVKYDYLGNLIDSTKFDNGFDDYATGITVNRLGEFYVSGYSATGPQANDDYDFVVFRYKGLGLQAPSPFTVTPHNTSADLRWIENDTSVTGYEVYRNTGSCSTGKTPFNDPPIFTLPKGTAAVTDNGLTQGQTYCYGILSYRTETNDLSRTLERQVSTSTPVPPDSVVAYPKSTSEIEVCWHDNSASEDGFKIQRCAGDTCLDFADYDTAPAELDPLASETCYVDTKVCDSGSGKTFRYRVQAYKTNAWNSGYDGQTGSVTPIDLVAPVLTASRVAESKVDLEWTDNTVDETDFKLERCQGSGCVDFVEISAISGVSNNALLLNMDEASWTTGTAGQVLDQSGMFRPGTPYNATINSDAHSGKSGSFNGSSSYVTVPLLTIDQSSAQTAAVTMMGWVKPTTTSSGKHYLFSTEDGTASAVKNSWGLLRDTGTWQVATGESVQSTGVAVDSGKWQHVAVVFTPGTGVKFYKDGVLVSTINSIGYHDTSANFTIGRQGILTTSTYFDGLVDEVAVYNKALSLAEIQQLRTVGIFPYNKKWYADGTVSAITDYQYRVTARKQVPAPCGTTLSPPSNVLPVYTAPLAPQPLTATLPKSGIVVLTWTPQTTTQTGYEVVRCNGNNCTSFDFGSPLSSPGATATSFTDNTACYGSDGIIRYQIRAAGPWGYSPPSTTATVTVGTPSAGPNPLTATKATEANVSLNWKYSVWGVDGYHVERCLGDSTVCTTTSTNYTPVPASPYAGADPALQALWHMDELSWSGSVGEVVDSSGRGRHGTAKMGVLLDPTGSVDAWSNTTYGAGLFDGNDDYIDTGLTIDQSDATPGATFMAWIKPSTSSGNRYVFSTSNSSGDYDWGLSLNGMYLYVDTGSTSFQSAPLTMDVWWHVAVVFNPNGGVKIYRNGSPYNSSTNISFDSSTNPIILGRNPMSTTTNFTGKMDEVAVFSRVLSDTEISQYYSRTNPISFTDTDPAILPGTVYTYKVTPYANTGCGDWRPRISGSRVSVSTLATAAAAPTGLAATVINSTEIDLSWTANTSTETGFEIERCSGTNCTTQNATTFTTGAGVTTYKDTSVCNNTIYRYKVRAVKSTAPTWETPFSPQTADTQTSAATAAALTATPISESLVSVAWDDPNLDEDSYQLARCQVVNSSTPVACDQEGQFSELATYPGTVSGVQLLYRMDEASWNGTAGEVVDVSGNVRHGVSNGATTVDSGHFGRAGNFNGTSNYVTTPYSITQTQGSAGVTMEAWVYPNFNDATPRSVLSTENGGFDWGVVVQNGKWWVNTGLSQKDTGLTVVPNTWQHITAVFTPLSGITFYKGGESFSSTEIGYDMSTNPLVIGKTANSAGQFAGRIDEVLVYARPLSATEVARHTSNQERTPSALFTYSDTNVEQDTTYKYRVIATKAAGCGWSSEIIASATTPVCPPPESFTVVSKTTTGVTLSWLDKNGSETGYTLSRCDGANGGCSSPVLQYPGAGAGTGTTMTYTDNSLSPGQSYSYRLWATGGCGPTSYKQLYMTTNAKPAAPTGLTATKISEVEIDLTWNFVAGDETGVKLQRCIGPDTDCVYVNSPNNLAPATTNHADNELLANTEYCYRVSVYRDATPGGWETMPTDQVCATTSFPTGSLVAAPDLVKTSTVHLAWDDTYQTETGSTVQRCEGDLLTCCDNNPVTCSGSFTQLPALGPNQNAYVDTSACAGTAYTYRVSSMSEGLSNGNNNCWTRRAQLTFPPANGGFLANSGVEVIVAYKPEMNANFSDIRFYDSTAHRELPYWIKSKTDSNTATVWVMTGANNAIYLYYGNALATDASSTDSLFTEVYDQFPGTQINPQKWVVIDPPSDKISQNNGLLFTSRDSGNPVNDAAVFSTQTFERAAGNELYFDFTSGSDFTSSYYESLMLGWEKDQTSSTAFSGNGVHLLDLTAYSAINRGGLKTYGGYYGAVYENSYSYVNQRFLYNDLTHYQVKIVLNGSNGSATHGALYYIKGGKFADWTLLLTTSTSIPADDVLRISFRPTDHNVTVHQVKVKHVSAKRNVTISPTVEGSGSTCLNFTNTWTGNLTQADDALTKPAMSPADLAASVVEGKVELTWSAGTGDETEFRVERNCGGGYSQIGASPGGTLTYSDASMPSSASCSYQVKGYKDVPALCPAWTNIASNEATILTPPAGPVVEATAANSFQIRLDWEDAADETGYDVEAQIFNGSWVAVASLPAGSITYMDSHSINPSSLYRYRVRAHRGTAYSAWGHASASTPAYTPGAATCPLP